MTPELSHPVRADRVGPAGLALRVEAQGAELPAIARRLAIPAVVRLACAWRLEPGGAAFPGAVLAQGTLDALVVRECVATLEPFEQPVHERFRVRFVEAGRLQDSDDLDDDDELPFDGTTLDLGEATLEQLALALDPYPRRPEAAPPADGPAPQEALNPFARLKLRHGG